MYVIKSSWDTPNLYWDGGMWKPSKARARLFETHEEAAFHFSTLTWIDFNESDLSKREKPVTDATVEKFNDL